MSLFHRDSGKGRAFQTTTPSRSNFLQAIDELFLLYRLPGSFLIIQLCPSNQIWMDGLEMSKLPFFLVIYHFVIHTFKHHLHT